MSGKVLNYYAGGNTARGFYSLYESNLEGLDRLFILKGGPGTGKSSLMKSIAQEWEEKGYSIELLHCSSDNDSIDGVIIRALKVGIVDGTAPHVIEPRVPGVTDEYINLGDAWNSKELNKHKHEIAALTSDISNAFKEAYSTFAEALKVHDEWEEVYISNMDFTKANQLTEELIEKFYNGKSLDKQGDIRHRFLGAATPKGANDFIPNLTEDVPKRYLIKGRPGSGKSTMLKKLAVAGEEKGYDVEVYHCGFDPHSLDMLIVRELGFAIFDSTAPHEYFAERESDEYIDMYERLIESGTDEKYADQIEDVSNRYAQKMKEATSHLAKAKELHDELEAYYINAMDFTKVNEYHKQINEEINHFHENHINKSK